MEGKIAFLKLSQDSATGQAVLKYCYDNRILWKWYETTRFPALQRHRFNELFNDYLHIMSQCMEQIKYYSSFANGESRFLFSSRIQCKSFVTTFLFFSGHRKHIRHRLF